MKTRFKALQESGKRQRKSSPLKQINYPANFGQLVFTREKMREVLPQNVYQNIVDAMEGRDRIKEKFADEIAIAMKEWALEQGASHYTHWFQPLTGSTAEKHDSFLDFGELGEVIDKFTGQQLVQGEPDASSFPSGGLRSTYEARGYTGWDPSSPVFLWQGGDGLTLCIPSVFFSYTGNVLDNKIPLLRSDQVINKAVLRLLELTGIEAKQVFSTLGLEQEYFVIDRALRNLRPDIVIQGRTVQGAPPPKGQEMQDHYFGSVKDRILAYMQDFEEAALKLGIPLKTRHNEVAPAQHEVAHLFEKSSSAVDHNILLMELMRQIAIKHDLSCLLHEKPFANLNGSGKHSNWSLMTNTSINLLDPTDTPENNLHFLVILTAILNAVYRHAKLLRASIGSASNDCRLGGHEAPPAIMSIYLGDELEKLLDEIEEHGAASASAKKGTYDLGLSLIPDLTRDNTDRNRTSPFAFTGNKFEFRSLGSSASPAFSAAVLNAIVADSLHEMIDEIEEGLAGDRSKEALFNAVIPVVQKFLRGSKPIRYSGDNYSHDWIEEAAKRGLPNLPKCIDAFSVLTADSTIRAFKDVLSETELSSRYEVELESYSIQINIQANLLAEIFRTQILPAAVDYQHALSSSISGARHTLGQQGSAPQQSKLLAEIGALIEEGLEAVILLEEKRDLALEEPLEQRARSYCFDVLQQCERLRLVADKLEILIDDDKWPLPKYRELLFMV